MDYVFMSLPLPNNQLSQDSFSWLRTISTARSVQMELAGIQPCEYEIEMTLLELGFSFFKTTGFFISQWNPMVTCKNHGLLGLHLPIYVLPKELGFPQHPRRLWHCWVSQVGRLALGITRLQLCSVWASVEPRYLDLEQRKKGESVAVFWHPRRFIQSSAFLFCAAPAGDTAWMHRNSTEATLGSADVATR